VGAERAAGPLRASFWCCLRVIDCSLGNTIRLSEAWKAAWAGAGLLVSGSQDAGAGSPS
jgi:hypothetical protein